MVGGVRRRDAKSRRLCALKYTYAYTSEHSSLLLSFTNPILVCVLLLFRRLPNFFAPRILVIISLLDFKSTQQISTPSLFKAPLGEKSSKDMALRTVKPSSPPIKTISIPAATENENGKKQKQKDDENDDFDGSSHFAQQQQQQQQQHRGGGELVFPILSC